MPAAWESTRCHPEQGFSLLELVIVISILGILTGLAVPIFLCLVREAKASSAIAAIIQIARECEVGRYRSSDPRFTIPKTASYSLQTTDGTNCDQGSGRVTLVPDDANELPSFFYSHSLQKVTYSYKGIEGEDINECKEFLCGSRTIPDNNSSLFGSDSGLSCRISQSTSLPLRNGAVYLDGGDSRIITVQPVTISIGSESWKVTGVTSKIRRVPHSLGTGGADTKWLTDFATAAASKINDSESGYSAEADPSNPGNLLVYGPSGTPSTDIEFKVDSTVGGEGVNQILAGTNPYAYPGIGDQDGWTYTSKTSESASGLTTVCDGR